MIDNTKLDIINKAIKMYGEKNQSIIAVEEAAEWQKEIIKFLRYRGDKSKLIEETADLYIMLTQVMIIYDISPKALEMEVDHKLMKLQRKMDETMEKDRKQNGKKAI